MTLKEIMSYEQLKYLTVINQNADMDRDVTTVESTETPDVAAYVAKDSFIITTAMIYKGNQDKLCDLILQLNALPCAGLGIKIGRFVEKLDPSVIETADSIGFPLFIIPMSKTLGDVYHDVLSIIWDTRNRQLIEMLNAQRKYYEVIVRGSSLRHLLNIIGTSIKKHLLLFDRFGSVLSSHNVSSVESKLANECIERIDFENCDGFSQTCYNLEGQPDLHLNIYPIKSISKCMYYMMVFDYDTNSACYMMEEIIQIIGMFFYKELFIKLNRLCNHNAILKVLLQNDRKESWMPMRMLNIAQAYDIKKSNYYRVVVCRLRCAENTPFQSVQMTWSEEKYIAIYEFLCKRIKQTEDGKVIVLPDHENWRYVLLIQKESESLARLIPMIKQEIARAFQEVMIFGYGNVVTQIFEVANSYWEATELLKKIEKNTDQYLIEYKPQNVMELLKDISEFHVQDVCRTMLGSLAFPDNEMDVELRHTLKTYLNCYCSIVQTANMLYVHRNTVRYRLKRCEEMLNIDLTDADLCFQLQMCIFMADMICKK